MTPWAALRAASDSHACETGELAHAYWVVENMGSPNFWRESILGNTSLAKRLRELQ